MTQQKTAVIIGGTSGYGLGIANTLLSVGWRVITGSRTAPPPNSPFQWGRVDVTKPSMVEFFSTECSKVAKDGIHAVIYSAGIAIGKEKVVTGSPADWQAVMATNTIGLMNVAKAFMKCLYATSGHLIHIGSIAAFINYPGGADYCASKAASSSIMATLRYELIGSGIHTTSIEPGLGNTNFQFNRYKGDEELAKKHYAGIKQLEPEDLGETVLWILSQPLHVNIDQLIIKPLDQVTHGVTTATKTTF